MAKIRNPKRFSDVFNIDHFLLEQEGVFDPILNVDTKLFIDPLLIQYSKVKIINTNAKAQYLKHFENIIKLLSKSKKENDIAWQAAERLIDIKEAQGSCLGYGTGTTRGKNLQKDIVKKLLKTAKEIVDIGIDDPELFTLLPLIQDGIGPDFISDYITSIIEPQLLDFTQIIAEKLELSLTTYDHRIGRVKCLINPTNRLPVLLLPSDILCKLPTVSDWSGIKEAAEFNEKLRNKVNNFITEIWAKKAKRDKVKLKAELIQDKDTFKDLLSIVNNIKPNAYDIIKDESRLLIWHEWLKKAGSDFPLEFENIYISMDGLKRVVLTIINQFQFLIEHRGLNKLLWNNGAKLPEKVSQMLFYAVAYSYCRSNNIDINPEIDTGTGLIDFKFSQGFNKKIIVELKLSSNQNIVTGYTKQLEIYKKSEETICGYYIVINVGQEGNKLKNLENIESEELSKVFIIDGCLKKSASRVK